MVSINKTDKEWKKILTPDQYKVLRKKGTEKAFTGKYLDNKKKGKYLCTACGNELFSSETKFDSGTGWPSFWNSFKEDNIELESDMSLGVQRTEVKCARCGGHLGHVFNDGPSPTNLRFCINSIALNFKEEVD